MANENEQEVYFLLKALRDPSIRREFKAIAQEARDTQKVIDAAHKEAAQKSAQYWKEYTGRKRSLDREEQGWQRAAEREAVDSNRRVTQNQIRQHQQASEAIRRGMLERVNAEKQAANASARAQKEAADKAVRAQKEQNKRTIDGLKQQEREATKVQNEQNKKTIEGLKRQEQEAVRQEHAAERAARTQVIAYRRILASSASLLHGIVSLGRGIALMTASSEKDVEKLMRAFMQVEAITGMIQAVIRLARVWESLRRSILMAAAAQEAYNASQVRGAATAAASGAGAGARSGAISGAAGGLITRIGGGSLGAFLGGVGAGLGASWLGKTAAENEWFGERPDLKLLRQIARQEGLEKETSYRHQLSMVRQRAANTVGSEQSALDERVFRFHPVSIQSIHRRDILREQDLRMNQRAIEEAQSNPAFMGADLDRGLNRRLSILRQARNEDLKRSWEPATIYQQHAADLQGRARVARQERVAVEDQIRGEQEAGGTTGEGRVRAHERLALALEKEKNAVERAAIAQEEAGRKSLEAQQRNIEGTQKYIQSLKEVEDTYYKTRISLQNAKEQLQSQVAWGDPRNRAMLSGGMQRLMRDQQITSQQYQAIAGSAFALVPEVKQKLDEQTRKQFEKMGGGKLPVGLIDKAIEAASDKEAKIAAETSKLEEELIKQSRELNSIGKLFQDRLKATADELLSLTKSLEEAKSKLEATRMILEHGRIQGPEMDKIRQEQAEKHAMFNLNARLGAVLV